MGGLYIEYELTPRIMIYLCKPVGVVYLHISNKSFDQMYHPLIARSNEM